MTIIYEEFKELADAFCDGHSITHALSDHSEDDCLAWQQGVREFAKWLDEEGYVVKITEEQEVV